jgi:beta-lysine 5,6-aminomutase beta subunit
MNNPHGNEIRPYGDTLNDGKVQMSFTLPVPASPESAEAARELARKMGLEEPEVCSFRDLGEGFSFYILYGRCTHSVDISTIHVAKVDTETLNFYDINSLIEKTLDRKIRVVGACTGSDAHTVGLDAIMNMKGYAGEYGLERYPWFETWNMGSQVPNEEMIRRAVEVNADALLVSQVVTQKEVHIHNLTELVELLEAEGLRDRFLLVVGGPRISHELALELGYDAGFGPSTLPVDVASYIAQTLVKRSRP